MPPPTGMYPRSFVSAACIIHRATAALMGERTSWSSQRRSEAVGSLSSRLNGGGTTFTSCPLTVMWISVGRSSSELIETRSVTLVGDRVFHCFSHTRLCDTGLNLRRTGSATSISPFSAQNTLRVAITSSAAAEEIHWRIGTVRLSMSGCDAAPNSHSSACIA